MIKSKLLLFVMHVARLHYHHLLALLLLLHNNNLKPHPMLLLMMLVMPMLRLLKTIVVFFNLLDNLVFLLIHLLLHRVSHLVGGVIIVNGQIILGNDVMQIQLARSIVLILALHRHHQFFQTSSRKTHKEDNG